MSKSDSNSVDRLPQREQYLKQSHGNPFAIRGLWWRPFHTWYEGSRVGRLPWGIRHLAMVLRNWLLYRKPRRIEYRYASDGFATKSRLAFMTDPTFVHAYERMLLARGEANDLGIHLRVHQALWVASVCRKLPGDFVECGTGRGLIFSAILDYLKDWNSLGKTAWLFDTFSPYHLNQQSGQNDPSTGVSGNYAVNLESTRRNFQEWPRVNLVPGMLPDSLNTVDIKSIALLHLDLNFAAAEETVLSKLWPLVVEGGIVLLDDYGQTDSQNETHTRIAKQFGVEILTTGSAQGVIIKR